MKLTAHQIYLIAQHIVTAEGHSDRFNRAVLLDPALVNCGPESATEDQWDSLIATLEDVLLD